MKIGYILASLLSLGLFAIIAACDPPPVAATNPLTNQRTQAAQQVRTEQTYSYEINNIGKRRILFGKPGVVGYVVFLNEAGQPVQYLTVDGKCTSSGKRITPTEVMPGWSEHPYVLRTIGEDGAFGDSESYIYCFTTSGRYVQWSGQYLYSNAPFDLTTKPLVIDLSGKQQGQ